MDLTAHINELLDKLDSKLQVTPWRKVKERIWEYEGSRSYFILKNDILTYIEGVEVTKFWFRIDSYAFSDESKESLFSVVQPFYCKRHLGNSYWINPYYPKGFIDDRQFTES